MVIYPGTFDPVTLGHLDIINRAGRMFGEVIVAAAEDNNKNTLFSSQERVKMIESSISSNCEGNIKVVSFSGLLVDFAIRNNAKILIRGLRAASDFEYEFQMSAVNSKLNNEIQTIFLPAAENMHFISSRLVKEVAKLGGDVSKFLTKDVKNSLLDKIHLKN
jgi:pantetheine-phosphate adenylyltransferase